MGHEKERLTKVSLPEFQIKWFAWSNLMTQSQRRFGWNAPYAVSGPIKDWLPASFICQHCDSN